MDSSLAEDKRKEEVLSSSLDIIYVELEVGLVLGMLDVGIY